MALVRELGPFGLSLLGIAVIAAAVRFTEIPVVYTSGQLVIKIVGAVAVFSGVRRYRPEDSRFWWALFAYFALGSIRNIGRVVESASGESWRIVSGSGWEIVLNVLTSAALAAAAVLLLRSRRARGNWALADAWVLGAAVLLAIIRLVSIPVYQQLGPSLTFWNVGVVAMLRDTIVLVPIVALLYSERVRNPLVGVLALAMGVGVLADLTYNTVGANLATPFLLDSTIILLSGAVLDVCQIFMFLPALLPAMRTVTEKTAIFRPAWDLPRTVVMTVAVLAPIAVIILTKPLAGTERMVLIGGVSMLLVVMVARLRLAATTTNESLNELTFLASHDVLTGLTNRRHLQETVVRDLEARAEAAGSVQLSACYIDIDDLKEVNDRLDHLAGDQVVRGVAESLRALPARPGREVMRVGGDEFVVLTRLESPDPAKEAITIGNDVLAAVNRQAEHPDHLDTRASVGSSWTTLVKSNVPFGRAVDHLIHQADLAQVEAKRAGGGRITHFDDELGVRARRRLAVSRSLPNAWDSGEMSLVYQPVVRLSDGAVFGAESLLRWQHPNIGRVPPQEAIQAAEDLGMIGALGLNILDRAMLDVENLPANSAIRVGVNLSAHQLRPAAIHQILEHIMASQVADQLWLEVTEQLLVEERRYAAGALEELRGAGVIVAIDDFGTGYCGLDYLCTIPADIVKLDGEFAMRSDSDTRRRVARLGVELAEAIGAQTLAEAIETYEISRIMEDLGCTYGQGYAFRRPVAGLEAATAEIPDFALHAVH